MPAITRTIKNDKVFLKTRISNGFDENGKRIRNRYSYEVLLDEYPTEELQDKAFIDYLLSIGVKFDNDKKSKQKEKTNKKVKQQSSKIVTNESTRKIVKIPLDQLETFELNPSRPSQDFIKRLAKSIYEDGLNNPIRVIKTKDKYLIETGNKRYRAYRYLEEQYGSQYSNIECCVLDYNMELNNENLDPVFTLKLMRDNVNTYERTIKDKILEVELYHRIFPDLKARGIAAGRENEWIGQEMGIADASVKDYLKLIKVDDIKKKFLNDEVDYLQTALKLTDYYNQYGKDDYYKMIGTIKENHQTNNDFQIGSYMVDQHIWNKEYEERQKKAEELQKERDKESRKKTESKEIKGEYEPPVYKKLNELPQYYFEGNKVENMNFRFSDTNFELTFFMVNILDNIQYYFELDNYSGESVVLRIFRKPEKSNEYWYRSWYGKENILFELKLYDQEDYKTDGFELMNNVILLLNQKHIVLTIDENHNFIGDLLNNVVRVI